MTVMRTKQRQFAASARGLYLQQPAAPALTQTSASTMENVLVRRYQMAIAVGLLVLASRLNVHNPHTPLPASTWLLVSDHRSSRISSFSSLAKTRPRRRAAALMKLAAPLPRSGKQARLLRSDVLRRPSSASLLLNTAPPSRLISQTHEPESVRPQRVSRNHTGSSFRCISVNRC